MDNVQLFSNDLFGNVRSIIDQNGEPWFVASDIAKALGYERPSKAIQDHVDIEDKAEVPIWDFSSNQNRRMIIINESGLYQLIFSSKLPIAKKFKHWVTSQVLPAMRKIGFNNALQLLQQEVDKLQTENKDLHHQIDTFNALCENKLVEIHF